MSNVASKSSEVGTSDELLENVKAAKPNGTEAVRFQLNRSAFITGKKIAKGSVHERTAALQLIEAGISSGLSKVQATDAVAKGISDGKRKGLQEIAQREHELEALKDSWGVSAEESAIVLPLQSDAESAAPPKEERALAKTANGSGAISGQLNEEDEEWPVYPDTPSGL